MPPTNSRSLIAALGLLCAASLPAQAAFAQNAGDPPTIAEMKAQDAAAMAASESRVKAFFAAQDVKDMMVAADGGDWIEQVRPAEELARRWLLYSRRSARRNLTEVCAGAPSAVLLAP